MVTEKPDDEPDKQHSHKRKNPLFGTELAAGLSRSHEA
jgi:hypothetical protein